MIYTTKQESKNKRSLHYSNRHREYGYRLIASDVDMIEYSYDTNEPIAMFEEKHPNIQMPISICSVQFKCHIKTANKLRIPYFIVIPLIFGVNYSPLNCNEREETITHIQYMVAPINKLAADWTNQYIKCNVLQVGKVKSGLCLTEREYIRMLYALRNEAMPVINSYDKWLEPVSVGYGKVNFRYLLIA